MQDHLGYLQNLVFDSVKEADKRGGITCDEVEVLLGLRHQTASARLRELVLKGKIRDSGGRRATRSGRLAVIYVIEEEEEWDMLLLAVDFETHLFKPGCMSPKPVCLSYATDRDVGLLVGDDMREELKDALEREDVTLIGHNMAYDMAVALEHFPDLRELIWREYDEGRIQCTYCREKLLDIAIGAKGERAVYHLAYLVKKHFNIDLDKKTWRTGYAELDGIPLEEWPQGAKDYAMGDARVTYDLFDHQLSRSQACRYSDFEPEAARQAGYSFALKLTSNRGVMIDQDQVDLLKEEMGPLMAEAREKVLEAGLFHKQSKKDIREGKYRKNLKVIREKILETFPDPENVPRTEKKGSVCTDADTIAACEHPALNALSELNGLVKIDSTYVEVFRKAKDKPIHAGYDVLQKSGRTSSFKPNLQNQPRLVGIRECIRARSGWVFISCDYDAQELRTLGQVCLSILGHSTLAEKFQEDPDFDPHTHLAAQLLDLDYERALELKAEGDEGLLDYRQKSKAANFGFPGGLGAEKFLAYAQGYGIDMQKEEAENLRKHWFEQWPEMREYFQHITQLVSVGGGELIQLWSERVRGGCGFCDGANSYFQGLAADASKLALYKVTRACFGEPGSSPLAGCRPVWFIHDEIGIESPESYAHESALELEEVMVAAMETVCSDVPARASAALMRRWSKKAKQVTNGDGRLIPWEDAN